MSRRSDSNISEMLNICILFIESLNEFYEKHGFLTRSQYEALERFHGNL